MSDMADLLERYNDCCERLSEAERERDEYGVSCQRDEASSHEDEYMKECDVLRGERAAAEAREEELSKALRRIATEGIGPSVMREIATDALAGREEHRGSCRIFYAEHVCTCGAGREETGGGG